MSDIIRVSRVPARSVGAARLPLAGGRPDATVTLHPLLCGRFRGPPRWFLGPPGLAGAPKALGIGVPECELLDVPIVAFLIEHPGAGAFLLDTGLHSSIALRGARESCGRLGALGYKDLRMSPAQAIRSQLHERGIPPAIKTIVMTHLHADHASALAELPGATVIVAKREWDNLGGALDGYSRRQLDADVDYRLLDLDADGTPTTGFSARSTCSATAASGSPTPPATRPATSP
jgi:glyoxylase-like metal-dependent hydrolase (beta-lactamase superfamily II)